MMLEGAGFEVIDLGINTDVDKFLAALELHQPDILGMSALLTTTMPYMKVVIDTLIEKGLRDKYIVLVGGAPLNEEFGNAVGADAYCRDAAVAAETAKALVKARRDRLQGRAARPVGGLSCGSRHDRRAARHRLWSAGLRAARRARRPRVWPTRSRSRYLPANLHNRPERIVPELRTAARRSGAQAGPCSSPTPTAAPAARSTRCSTSIPSVDPAARVHCYEFFSRRRAVRGDARRRARARSSSPTSSPSTSRRWCGRALGLDRHPELRDMYFGNYRRVVLLSQTDDPAIDGDGPRRGRAARPRVRTPPRRAASRSPTAVARVAVSLSRRVA